MASDSSAKWPLLGRTDELAVLISRAELAIGGRGSIVIITGESGAGKSALVQEFIDWAASARIPAFCGASRADWSAPALWPWIEVVQQLASDLRAGDLPPALDLLLAETRRSANSPPHSTGEIDLARTFEQFLAFLRVGARAGPFVIVLEDVQWADQPSLRLLEYVAASMSRLPVLIVATARDIQPGEFSRTLAYLQRELSTRRVVLGRLSAATVGEMIEQHTGASPSRLFVSTLVEATAGNAFFVSELVRSLSPEAVANNEYPGDMPATVIDAVATRLALLRPNTLEVLSLAAVAGRTFSSSAVTLATEGEMGSVSEAMDEAETAGLIARIPGTLDRFAFVHAIVRDAVYADVPAPRRSEFHARLAGVVAHSAAASTPEGVAELANHSLLALPSGDAVRAVEAARKAGIAAIRAFDATTAAHHFAGALSALEFAPARAPQRAEILYLLGDAERRSGNVRGGKETLARAFEEAREAGDVSIMANAALSYAEFAEAGVPDANRIGFLRQALDGLSRDDSAWVPVMALLAESEATIGRVDDALTHSLDALTEARSKNDALPLSIALNGRLWAMRNSPALDERARLADEMLLTSAGLRNREHAVKAHRWRLLAALESGDRSRFVQEMEAHSRDSAVIREPVILWRSACHQVLHSFLRGDFAEAERDAERAAEAGRDVNSRGTVNLMALQRHIILREQGRASEVQPGFLQRAAAAPENPMAQIAAASSCAAAGDLEMARMYARAAWEAPRRASLTETVSLPLSVMLAEVATAIRDTEMCATLRGELEPHRGRIAVMGDGLIVVCPVAQVLAQLQAMDGQWDAAEDSFEIAMNLAARIGAPWMTANILEARARVLRSNPASDPGNVQPEEMLRQALEIGQRLGMAALIERIQALTEPR